MAGELEDYAEMTVAAARSVIIELVHLLGEYREDVVLVGGWIPSLLIPDAEVKHVGSADVDLALNHRGLPEAGYETIEKLLLEHGYEKVDGVAFQYLRGSGGVKVQVDLLAGEYGGTGKRRRHQRVRGAMPRKARGCDLAFEIECVQVPMEGTLPDGSRDRVTVPVASIVPFLVMKSMALAGRLKPKDAYDIWYCLRFFPGGIEAIVEAFRPQRTHGLVREAISILDEKFAGIDHVGPKYAGEFDTGLSQADQAVRREDAFQRVRYLIEQLGDTQAS